MGFTKLDERILQSSIMAESATTFKVWIALLAACRENGIAYVSATYLSSICHLSMAKVDDALRRLESPDDHSRSLADEGRRIRRVDGGYEIINYAVYRDVSLRDAEAERKRLYRQRHKGCPDNVPGCPDSSASVSASASASAFDAWWSLYPKKVARLVAMKAYLSLVKAGVSPDDLTRAVEGYRIILKRDGTVEKYCLNPSTFLHSERWKDYLDIKAPLRVGESRHKDDKPAGYWDEVRRLRATGVEGEALTNKMKEWEAAHV